MTDKSQTTPQKVEYAHDDKGTIILPDGAPFDGESYLIKFPFGWCEAWWAKGEISEHFESGVEYNGFEWVCCDDKFTEELDDAKYWMPLPAAEDTP